MKMEAHLPMTLDRRRRRPPMHVPRRPFAILLMFAVAAAGTIRLGAQDQLASQNELDSLFYKHNAQFAKLASGQQAPTAADREGMDAMAKWLVYRFVSTPPKSPADMDKLKHAFDTYLITRAAQPEAMKGNKEFVRQFNPILIKRYRDLFDRDFQDYRYPIVNAAPTLVQVAKLRDDAFGDYLAELITKEPDKHDVVKFYAVRALREFYAPGERSTNAEKVQPAKPVVPVQAGAVLGDATQKKMERDLRYANAVLKFAENRPGAGKLPLEEQEVLRIFRRHAIETLAAMQAPTVVYDKNKIDPPIAPFLLRVLSPYTDLEPAPGLAEKVEAAIGVCQMQYKNVPEYQPELGVYLVGLLVADFMTEANKDVGQIAAGKSPAMHWRLADKRLELALKDLVNNAKGQPVEANAKRLEAAAGPLLKDMGKGKTIQGINPGMLNEFRKMAMSMRPKSNEVFKGMKYTINLGE
jgi:hypothetical protein